MQVDAAAALAAVALPLSRSPSPLAALAPSASAAAATAADLPLDMGQQQQHVSSFVPMGEMGGSAAASPPLAPQQLSLAAADDEDEEPSSLQPSTVERPASGTGYESGDDMDMMSVRHCTNCTGPLWGHICMDCGHMTAHDDDIFQPTVASAAALHRPRLQGDALTVISWDERMELHEEGGGGSMHPERPDRVRAVMARLQAAELAGRCRRLPGREASAEEIGACHIPELLEAVDVLSEQSRLQGNAGLHFSPDTYVNQHTAMCAKLSAGACVDVTTAVMHGEARAGVAVVRPPGHHAESNTAMGFCFFNNAGIAARAAQAAGAERVLVLDWDVHHGNGTQHIFEGDSSVLYMSLHRYDGGSFYPGTGAAHEVGEGAGEGYSVNVPWPCGGMRNADYMAAFHHVVLPIAYEYAPDLVIISAGFDAAEGDPIGGCHLTPECYAHMAAQLQLVAPTVALLEGGYNLVSTAKGTEAVLRVLLGERPPPLPSPERPARADALSAVAQVMRIQARYWDCMRGVVQQQFKVLAAAAARQEQLASMKARRVEAVGGGSSHGHGADEEEEEEEVKSPRSGMCAEDSEELGMDEGLEEGEALLGSMPRLRHTRLPPGLEGMDEETDTPHQQYHGGSGWESDADLASGEQELSQGTSEEEGLAVGPDRVELPDSGWASPASSPQVQQHELEQGLASDTLPISESDNLGSGSTSDGNTGGGIDGGDSHGSAGLTAGSLSPAAAAGTDCGDVGPVITPAGEQLLASATPASGQLPSTSGPLLAQGLQPAGPAAGDAALATSSGGVQRSPSWKALAVKAVVLKRPGHVAPHQRLSPALLEGEAMQLVSQREQQAPPPADQQQQ